MDDHYPNTPGYVAGSDTSAEAAESMTASADALRARVFAYIAMCDQGATC